MPAFGIATVVLDGRPVLAAVTAAGPADTVHPLDRLLGRTAPTAFAEALADWDHLIDQTEAALEGDATDSAVPADGVRFRPPGVERPAIWCAGANYRDHVAEMGGKIDKRAFHFLSPPSVLAAHGDPVHRPSGVTRLDWEVELAAVIGRRTRRVAPEDALDHVAGYTVANDVSVRDRDRIRHPVFGTDWTAAKNADGLTPLGPAVVPARFVPDPADLALELTVNGAVRQRSNTSLMIVDLPEQLAALSALVTLEPGDLVLTGTPAGTAAGHGNRYLDDGDVMVATIAGVGTLRNTVV
jgi:2-keto-4-pentenoate hydratase/2-oxohepta-3-ene-1,7-dioic acid hydratase in catechol pathway